MENLHLKNLDLEKAFKKSKTQELPEQIKVNIQTPTVIDVDEEDEENEDELIKTAEKIVNVMVIGCLIIGLYFAFTHPYLMIDIGKTLYNFGDALLSP